MTAPAIPNRPLAFAWHFIRPYWKLELLLAGSATLGSVIEGLQPYIVKLLIDTANAGGVHPGQAVIDGLLRIGGLFLLLRLGVSASWWLFETLHMKLAPKLEQRIKNSLFDHILEHPYAWFLNGFSGRTGQRADTIPRAFIDCFERINGRLIYVVLRSLTILGVLIWVDRWLGLVMLLWALLYVPVSFHLSVRTEVRAFERIEALGHYIERLVDIVTNIFSVRVSGGATLARERGKAEALADDIRLRLARLIGASRLSNGVTTLINTLLYAGLFLVGLWRWQAGAITLGSYALALSSAIGLVDTISEFSKEFLGISQNIGSLREALSGLILPPMPGLSGQGAFRYGKGAIAFEAIGFSYTPARPVFRDFSLTIDVGEKVALVGASGAGKSTLVNLLLGLWPLESGRILIDGQDLAMVERESALAHIAVIPQDTLLFHRTLADNIAYGALGETNPAMIEKAARLAHIHDFIAALPEGYATMVGERGLKLSGGQRQRIAIARAMLKNAPILLLDEATSALDSESERAIQDSLHRLLTGRTVLAIAHRLSTIAHMDRIILLDQGRIVEQGSHAGLLAAGGRYARLWAMQSGGYLPESERDAACPAQAMGSV